MPHRTGQVESCQTNILPQFYRERAPGNQDTTRNLRLQSRKNYLVHTSLKIDTVKLRPIDELSPDRVTAKRTFHQLNKARIFNHNHLILVKLDSVGSPNKKAAKKSKICKLIISSHTPNTQRKNKHRSTPTTTTTANNFNN